MEKKDRPLVIKIKKRDLFLAIIGFILLFIALFVGHHLASPLVTYHNIYPCDFNEIEDILDFIFFDLLLIAIPLIYIPCVIDVMSTKTIFETKQIFFIFFIFFMITYASISFFDGIDESHCSLIRKPVPSRVELAKIKVEIISVIEGIESNYGAVKSKTFTSKIVDKICFTRDNKLEMFSKGELLTTAEMNNIEIDEDPLCFEEKNNEFVITFEGMGDKTRIHR
ncbi:MAG: hypothetical protein PHV16_05060 [Candidatus Nanoarchaeia archaeon]|nr:hypothetical protein [Candidatus Nanoarchaeia archaeon]